MEYLSLIEFGQIINLFFNQFYLLGYSNFNKRMGVDTNTLGGKPR